MVTGAGWRGSLDRLVNAESLNEAYLRTAELIVDVLPGGSAPAEDASQVIEAITSVEGISQHRYRNCLLWILVLLRRWTGVFLAASVRSSIPASTLAHESETLRSLASASEMLTGMTDDPEPEVRSMIYRLLGSASELPDVISLLRGRAEEESDPLAQGCAVEGAFVAMIRRWPNVAADDRQWLREQAVAGELPTRGRIRHVLEGHSLVQSASLATEILSGVTGQLPPEGPFWPAESI
jgi:hypothetical protein